MKYYEIKRYLVLPWKYSSTSTEVLEPGKIVVF